MCHTYCWYRCYVAKQVLLLIDYLDLFYIVEIKNHLWPATRHPWAMTCVLALPKNKYTIKQERGRSGGEEGPLCVNMTKNATSIIRQLYKIMTSVADNILVTDAIFDSKFKSVPSIPSSQPLSTVHRNY